MPAVCIVSVLDVILLLQTYVAKPVEAVSVVVFGGHKVPVCVIAKVGIVDCTIVIDFVAVQPKALVTVTV